MSEKINYLVCVVFNERGIKLTGKRVNTFAVYSEPENLELYIHEIVPPQLIQSWTTQHDIRFLSGGDPCVIYNEVERLKFYGVIKEQDQDEPREGLVAYVFHFHDIIRFKRDSGVGSWYKVKYMIRPPEDEEYEEAMEEYDEERLRLEEEVMKSIKGRSIDNLLRIKHIIKKG